ncbi:UNVERIFIED_CONTAM: zinc finger protein [Trichonephila clavipes]
MCDLSDKDFSNEPNLEKDTLINTRGKSYYCKDCMRAFSSNSSLRRHLRIHTNDTPYICEMCKKGFSERDTFVKENAVRQSFILS